MEKNNDPDFKRSYESDGIMGIDKKGQKQKKRETKKREDAFFFNTTEYSE